VGGHRLRVLQRAVALELIGNTGCAHRMIADARFDARLARALLNHPVAVRALMRALFQGYALLLFGGPASPLVD
jgi:hypothetical protein